MTDERSDAVSRIDHQLVLAIHAERMPRDLEARVALAEPKVGRPNAVRRAVGRSLVVAGSWLADEPPPRPARSS